MAVTLTWKLWSSWWIASLKTCALFASGTTHISWLTAETLQSNYEALIIAIPFSGTLGLFVLKHHLGLQKVRRNFFPANVMFPWLAIVIHLVLLPWHILTLEIGMCSDIIIKRTLSCVNQTDLKITTGKCDNYTYSTQRDSEKSFFSS